jgi:general stress protein 26
MDSEASRPRIPAEYGVPSDTENLLPWAYVDRRMAGSGHYWLATTGPDGKPHVRPIDGMWLDGKLYFGGSAESKWRRNLERNPSVSINLEDGEQAVILQGEVREVRPDRHLGTRLAGASNEKYGYDQKPEDYVGVSILEFIPEVALAWQVLYEDATRWRLK